MGLQRAECNWMHTHITKYVNLYIVQIISDDLLSAFLKREIYPLFGEDLGQAPGTPATLLWEILLDQTWQGPWPSKGFNMVLLFSLETSSHFSLVSPVQLLLINQHGRMVIFNNSNIIRTEYMVLFFWGKMYIQTSFQTTFYLCF